MKKAYTDIEQSKKLAEILPTESADMCWCNSSVKGVNYTDEFTVHTHTTKELKEVFDGTFNHWDKYWELIPCWSLASLLEHLREIDCFPEIIDADDLVLMSIYYYDEEEGEVLKPVHYIRAEGKNILDACYKMIIMLDEQKLL